MPGLISLRATSRLDRLGLLGHPDRAHAALADLLQQLVRADRPCPAAPSRRGAGRARRRVGAARLPARAGGTFEEAAGSAVGRSSRASTPARGPASPRRPASRIGRRARPGRSMLQGAAKIELSFAAWSPVLRRFRALLPVRSRGESATNSRIRHRRRPSPSIAGAARRGRRPSRRRRWRRRCRAPRPPRATVRPAK